MRRAAKVDRNQSEITAGLRAIGATVQPLHTVGRGVPDLVVGWRGKNYLFEVKDGSKRPSARELTDDELRWHDSWRGQVQIIESLDDAIMAMR